MKNLDLRRLKKLDNLSSKWVNFSRHVIEGINICFHFLEPKSDKFDDEIIIDLGIPNEIESVMGNFRDGGCQLRFSASAASNQRFALYFYPTALNDMTLRLWAAYLETEPERAREDWRKTLKEINRLAK